MKIYKENNYIIVEYVNDGIQQGLAKNVFVRQDFINSVKFYIFGIAGGFKLETEGVSIGEIQDKNGVNYTIQTFIAFYTSNTGQ